MLNSLVKNQVKKFEESKHYDATYLHELLDSSTSLGIRFNLLNLISSFRKHAPLDMIYLARVGALQAEDCGPCLKLVMQFALAEGLDANLLDKAINDPERLNEGQRLALNLGFEVARNQGGELPLVDKAENLFGKAALAEIAVAIATARIYPAVKRSLGLAKSCELVAPLTLQTAKSHG